MPTIHNWEEWDEVEDESQEELGSLEDTKDCPEAKPHVCFLVVV